MNRGRALAGSALFLLVAPGTVAGVVPWAVSGWHRHPSALDRFPAADVAASLTGAALVATGALALLAEFGRFALRGRGTPAPVAPTERLVVGGAYRYVRNPMYVAVVGVLAGEVLLTRSPALALWAACATAAMAAFVRGYEEPVLRRQFGAEYEAYAARVPRWFPARR